ncbi:MAG: nicotinate-nucleotide--dimethylbenzimidazole phosphoribosyltransferase [Firmicutes bacterium]|nr:nicotinate-nucleotide--dimethylbenzimidazole phosphoribosyltransferase [Bacillota bacterium]
MNWQEIKAAIQPLDAQAMKQAAEYQDSLVKPAGSLGMLEKISIQIAGITGQVKNRADKKAHYLFGADNGVYAEGVTASPQEFTRLLMGFYCQGVNCGITVLCRQHNIDLYTVDMGIIGEVQGNVRRVKLMPNGTNNMAKEAAMPREIAEKAVETGFNLVKEAMDSGYTIISAGEVGMGNTTTAAACIKAVLQDYDLHHGVGRGAGLTDEAYARKKQVIADALALHRPDPNDFLDILSKVGGLDIAAMCGMYIGAAYYRIPIIVDGVIAIAGALLAYCFQPLVKDFLIPSHISKEPAYEMACRAMDMKPFLLMDMRLGEGSGCPIAMGIVDDALAIINEMNTFAEIQLSTDYQEGIHA